MQQEGKKTKVNMGAGVLFGITNACAYPESFVRGGPTLTKFFSVYEGGRIQQAIIGPSAKADDGQALNSGFVAFGFSRGSGPVLL